MSDTRDFSRQAFGRGLLTKGRGSVFPHQRWIILSLSLLDAVLLLTAVVIGIYCAKALQMPYTDNTPLMIEMKFLSNHSDITRAKMEAQAALVRERNSHIQMKYQVNEKKISIDGLQKQIETLKTMEANLQMNKTVLEESCGSCLQGWLLLRSSCYYFSSLSTKPMKNWHDSREDCISQGGDLVVINNLAEQVTINENVPKLSSSSSTHGLWWRNGFWIGLTDAVNPGTWVWLNNVTEVETMNWRTGQPSLHGPQSGNCAAFYPSSIRRTWFNGNCSDHQFNWICEMAARRT